MGSFEQLWYTSSEIGLEGRRQLQVRAASEGLTDQRSRLARAARRLCHYELPIGSVDSAPISFGWVDLGQTRFVFHRCDAGRDGFGRPGNFFAHILVGPVSKLDSTWVAQLSTSSFWRSDDSTLGSSLILPQVEATDIVPGPLKDPGRETATRFLTALARSRHRNRSLAVVTCDSSVVGSLLAWTSKLVAGTLDKISVSTYESSTSASSFNIVGIAAKSDAPQGAEVLDLTVIGDPSDRDPTIERFVDELMNGGSDDTREAIAAANAGDASEIRYDILVTAFDAMASLRTGAPIGIDQLLPAMRVPEGIIRVLRFSEGMNAVATSLVEGRDDVWTAVESSAKSLGGSEELSILGSAIGHRIWSVLTQSSPPNSIGILERARRLSVGLTGSLVAALLDDAMADVNVLTRLPTRERIFLAQQISLVPTMAQAGTGSPVVASLLAATDSEAIEFASAPVDDELKAWVVARALERSPARPDLAAAATREQQLLVGVVSKLAEAETLNKVIRPFVLASPASAVPAFGVVATSRTLNGGDRDAVVCALVQRPDLANPLGYLASFVVERSRDRKSPRLGSEIAEVFCRLVPQHVRGRLWSAEPLLPPEMSRAIQILAREDSGAAAWNRYCMSSRMVMRGVWHNPRDESLIRLAESISSIGITFGRSAQEAASECAADQLANTCLSYADVEDLRRWMSPFVGSSVRAHAERMLRAAYRQRNSRTQSLVALQWIAWQLDTRGIDGEGLRSSGLLRLAKALVSAQPSLSPVLDQIYERSQRPTARLLSSLLPQRATRKR